VVSPSSVAHGDSDQSRSIALIGQTRTSSRADLTHAFSQFPLAANSNCCKA
jgi:hypothetical protein